ncbi:MAG TPA: hypothetical protein VNR63_02275 [Gaiellaceae bacterium]|jgi:hypothetical protein|nr:hypothetical protein [Gaiellaceae bacterium]
MEQLAIVARLKPGTEAQAAELIAHGPPFDPESSSLRRHTVFLAADEVVFVFEGDEVEWLVDGLIDEPFHWDLLAAFDEWRPIVEEHPRIARAVYSWQAPLANAASFHG